MRGGGSLAKDRVRLLRHVFDLNTRHNAIMAPLAPYCNHSLTDVAPNMEFTEYDADELYIR